MKPNRAEQFAADLYRYCPLAIVALATMANVGTFRAAAHHQMDATGVLGRFALALLVATVAVRGLARLLVGYAARNLLDEQRAEVIDAKTVDGPTTGPNRTTAPSRTTGPAGATRPRPSAPPTTAAATTTTAVTTAAGTAGAPAPLPPAGGNPATTPAVR